MNDRLITLGGALLVLALVLGLVVPRGHETASPVSRPLSSDGGDTGLLGLARWLEQSGVPVSSLRERYTALPGLPAPARGNLLVALDPPLYAIRYSEQQALQRWIAAGNTVLVLTARGSSLDWAERGQHGQLLAALDLQWEAPGTAANPACRELPIAAAEAGVRRLLPPPQPQAHPLALDLRAVESRALPPKWPLERVVPKDRNSLPFALLCDASSRQAALSQLRLGQGRIWVSPFPDLFANLNLGRADNARLFANLAAHALGADGRVIFDDMHQGDSQLYDPAAFFRDPRLRHSLYFLAALWLLYLLGYSNRFGVRVLPARGISRLRFVRAVGGLYARTLSPATVAQGLLRHFFNDLRRQARLAPNGQPAWELLAQAPRADAALVAELRRLHARAAAGRRVELLRLHNLTLQLRKQLS